MKKLIYLMMIACFIGNFTLNSNAQSRARMVTAHADSGDQLKVEDPDEENTDKAGIRSANLISETSYPLTTASGIPLEDMSTGATELLGPSLDDTASEIFPIGFVFFFDGIAYEEISCNANGLCRLGGVRVTTAFSNSLATTTNAPKIAPLWDDLCTGSDGKVHFKLVGTEGNRKLVIEYSNMMMVRVTGCANPGDGTFQLWLHEGSGMIQFVYGDIAAQTSSSIGMQSGIAANIASVTSSADTVSYATANNANTSPFVSGKSYIFTPNVAIAPSGVNVTNVTAVSMDINWTDNSTTELGFLVERSMGGGPFEVVGTVAPDTTTFSDSGLLASTSYSYRVSSFTEGGVATSDTVTQATAAAGVRTAVVAPGNVWSSPATWVGGILPTASDVVVIPTGAQVILDTDAMIYGLVVGDAPAGNGRRTAGGTFGILTYDTGTTPRSLTVANDISVHDGLIMRNSGGAIDTHQLNVGGDIFVETGSTIGLGFTGNGIILTLISDNDATVTGGGNFGVFKAVMNKAPGATFAIDVDGSAGVEVPTDDNFLTLQSGIFEIRDTGTEPLAARTFATAAYAIPAGAGFKLSDPDYTVLGQNASVTVGGSLEIADGTFNVGTATGNSIAFTTGSNVTVSGGTINVAGRFGVSSTTQVINYVQTGGDITVQIEGNSSTTLGGFDMGTGLSSVDILGGTITIQNAASVATPIDYRMQAGTTGTATVHGATVYFGNANSSGPQSFGMRGVLPNFVVRSGHTVTNGTVSRWNPLSRSIEVEAGATVNFGTTFFLMNGETLTNNGTIIHTAAASRFIWFLAGETQTYQGSGVSSGVMTSFEAQNGGVIMDPGVQNVRVRRIILFVGGIVNSSKLTLGNNDATVSNIQIGNTTDPTEAGVFDSAPTFELGTGGMNISYLRGGGSRTTGPEVAPTRELNNLTHDNDDPTGNDLTITGGDLTVGGTLALTNGTVITGSNTLIADGTVSRGTGFVDGKLGRPFAAPGSFTFHVGSGGVYSPATANATAVGGPSMLVADANDGALPGLNGAVSLSRHWSIEETGDVTADLSFMYADADVNGNEEDYRVYSSGTSGITNHCPAAPCVTVGSNSAGPAAGVTEFGLWSAGELQSQTTEPASISGRVFGANGSPIRGVIVTLSGGGLPQPLIRYTGSFGHFSFAEIPTGSTYTVTVNGRKFTFATPSVQVPLSGDVTGLNFVAEPN